MFPEEVKIEAQARGHSAKNILFTKEGRKDLRDVWGEHLPHEKQYYQIMADERNRSESKQHSSPATAGASSAVEPRTDYTEAVIGYSAPGVALSKFVPG